MDKVVGIFKDGRGTQWADAVVDVLLASPEILNAKRKNPDSDA